MKLFVCSCCCSSESSVVSSDTTGQQRMEEYEKITEIIESKSGHIWHVRHKKTSTEYAMKIIPKTNDSKAEIDIHSRLNHPNIVKLHEHFADDTHYYMILDYCSYGDLFERYLGSHSKDIQPLTEKEVAVIAKQIASALQYLHSQGIMFGDLKPENILMMNDKTLEVKLCDFGMANEKPVQKVCGTLMCLAPEILLGNPHYIPSDLWTFGFLVSELIIQDAPLRLVPKTYKEHRENLKKHSSTTPFLVNMSEMMSKDAHDFVISLLKFQPEDRMTIPDALKHNFLIK
jgi:serine/threonine protein kinase